MSYTMESDLQMLRFQLFFLKVMQQILVVVQRFWICQGVAISYRTAVDNISY